MKITLGELWARAVRDNGGRRADGNARLFSAQHYHDTDYPKGEDPCQAGCSQQDGSGVHFTHQQSWYTTGTIISLLL